MPDDKKLSPAMQEAYERLQKVRASKTVALKPCSLLREEITSLDGKLEPFRLRYYQVQGVYHMVTLKHMILGDGTGLGKTVTSIASLCYLWASQREQGNKVIVVAPKSAIHQWADEIERFSIGVRPIVIGTEKPDPVATCTCNKVTDDKGTVCGHQWTTKATGKQIKCPKCKTHWAKPKEGKDGVPEPELIHVERESPVDARRREYEDWATSEDRTILVLNYAVLVRDWNKGGFQPVKPNGKPDPNKPVIPGLLDKITAQVGTDRLVTIFDECFDYYTPITMADGSTEIIGKIVCEKRSVEVLSWNWERGQLESRRVTRWIRNPLRLGRRETLVKLRFKYARSCRVTKSHVFYSVDGARTRVRDLKVGSKTASLNLLAPSEDQQQVVLGGLLGDASLCHPKRSLWGVAFVQGAAQREYLEFKRAILAPLGVSKVGTTPSGYGGQDIHRFRLRANPSLCSCFRLHDGKRKVLSVEWLDAVGPLGLAIWYGDNGSLQEHRCQDGHTSRIITLHTEGFLIAEQQLLVGWLSWRWGVRAEIKPTKKGLYCLYLSGVEAEKFLALLPGALPGVEQKFPGRVSLKLGDFDCVPRQQLVQDEVVSKDLWERAPKKRSAKQYVYDLEVESNHNYFAGGTLVSNCTAFKSKRTKTWEIAKFFAQRAHRVYGLTATLLKNRLWEGYCIYGVIRPGLFTTQKAFHEAYCFIELKQVGKARIPLIKSYKNLDHFRRTIDPYFLGRPKHVVSDELPTLTTREIRCELNPAEDLKYGEALSGVFELGDGEIRDYEDHKALVSLMYCQQVVNSLAMLRFTDEDGVGDDFIYDPKRHKIGSLGSKEEGLLDLITGELEDEKVIVYTRFASLVPRLQQILKKEGVKSVCITGRENDKARRKHQQLFQDDESGINVIFITSAGSEAINLQKAMATIFYDAPWSWGDYVQTLGRMIRIGSPHKGVLSFHLIAARPAAKKADQKTIDHHVLGLLRKKKGLIDKVLGEAAVGALKFDKGGGDIRDLVSMMQGRSV
jgi:superfamily II DNA or RNA helicase